MQIICGKSGYLKQELFIKNYYWLLTTSFLKAYNCFQSFDGRNERLEKYNCASKELQTIKKCIFKMQ